MKIKASKVQLGGGIIVDSSIVCFNISTCNNGLTLWITVYCTLQCMYNTGMGWIQGSERMCEVYIGGVVG